MMDQEIEVRAFLKERIGVFELYRTVLKFTGYRKAPNGTDQEIDVEVLDMGPDRPALRYVVNAISEDGKETRCNGAESILMALQITQWEQLDA